MAEASPDSVSVAGQVVSAKESSTSVAPSTETFTPLTVLRYGVNAAFTLFPAPITGSLYFFPAARVSARPTRP